MHDLLLGTWFQRTSIHLRELADVLTSSEADEVLAPHVVALAPTNIQYHSQQSFDVLTFDCGEISISITEDGIILLKLGSDRQYKEESQLLRTLYEDKLSPFIEAAFRHGAQLPKQLGKMEIVEPVILITEEVFDDFFLQRNEKILSSVHTDDGVDIAFADHSMAIRVEPSTFYAEDMARSLVFFREFERQLEEYLDHHRTIWTEVSKIREADNLQFKDFPRIRHQLLDYSRTLSFVDARLSQMLDILNARKAKTGEIVEVLFMRIGLHRFTHMESSAHYVQHLWRMTAEYVDGTLTLLQSLFDENAQRDINALKLITFLGALAGFFGMNIGFPWEERWPSVATVSISVVCLVIILTFVFHFVLDWSVFKRKFRVGDVGE